jgi:exosortase
VSGQFSAPATVTAAFVASVAAGVGWLYAPTAKGLALEWASSPDASYGAILAAVAAATIWSRRNRLRAAAANASHTMPGLFVVVAGLFTYLIGFLGADVFVTRVSLVIVIAGLVWFLAGAGAARQLAAPFAFLLIAVPLPALIVNAITLPLQLVASRLAEGLLGFAQVPVFRDGNVLELQSASLEVAEACSGLRSAISLTAIACLVAWATERSTIRRAIVIACALPIAILLNGIRIAATGLACEAWGPAAASGRWHTLTGWITFVVAVAVLAQVQRALPHLSFRRRTMAAAKASALDIEASA